jgi:anti-sigma-K factor RskA
MLILERVLQLACLGKAVQNAGYFSPADDLFLVDVRDLPSLEPHQVCEVWLIGEDSVPVPAGVFNQPTDQNAVIAGRDQYGILAITAEPGPLGTEAPTGEIVATASL